MSEIKRVPIQSSEFTAPAPKKKHEKIKPPACCFRFELNLSESNVTKFPEFNYVQLLKSAEKKRRKEKKRPDDQPSPLMIGSNGAPALPGEEEEDDDRVKKAAKYFEAKYGKAKRKNGDIDLGAGYDESDPFIDNTDAYDEIVPEEVTTVHGGFYINSGPLEFKNADNIKKLLEHVDSKATEDENDEEDDDEVEDDDESSEGESSEDESGNKKMNKRVLSSSENDEGDEKKPPKSKPKIDEAKVEKMEEG